MRSTVDSIIIWILCCTFSVLLLGCQAVPQKIDQPITLSLWQGVNPPANRSVLEGLVDRFNQSHPDIQVQSLYVGQGDQQLPKILAAAVGNALPDLLWYAPTLTGQLVELDVLRSLDDWLPTIPESASIDPALRESMELEGKTWSIPFGTNNVGLFYRPSVFKAAGITTLPQTWVELRSIAQQLTQDTNGDGKPDRYGLLLPLGKGEWSVFMWLPFLWSAGGELIDNGKITVNSSGAIAALQFWQDLIQDGSATLSQPERGYELDQFLAGKVAMQLTGPWTLGQLQQTGVDFAVMPLPQQTRSATAIGGENLFVIKSTPDRERAALQFAQYVLSEAFQTTWGVQTGYLPVNLKARENPAYQQFRSQQPAVDVFLAQSAVGRSRPIFLGYNRISEEIGRAIETVLLGRTSPETALNAAQHHLELTAESGYFNTAAKGGEARNQLAH
ncbi:MAG: ABC transporter substrate-binding protein [Alkalinema sp. CACIAM 70d]|nr:MAG: ABC transporter substrate-binding protein [Alkalinema sp. CACIAM 70d]